MTTPELKRFVAACLRDGRDEAVELAREALRRHRRRNLLRY